MSHMGTRDRGQTVYCPSIGNAVKWAVLAALLCMMLVMAAWGTVFGSTNIRLIAIPQAIFYFDGSREHLLVMNIRLPRVLAGLLAGGALAVSGAVMQAITANPLASPGLLGVNAGAAFAVVIVMTVFGVGFGDVYVWFAFAGAGIAALLVYTLGAAGTGGQPTVRLVLAGAIVGTFLTAITSAILIFDQSTLDAVRLWTAGSLSGRTMAQVHAIAPYIVCGLVASLFLGRHLMVLRLGTDTARSLGQSTIVWRSIAVFIAVLLAGSAVALAGPIGFVGLVVPHIVRLSTGEDYRWIIPLSAIGGALLVVAADTSGRLLFAAQEFPVGVTMAAIGAPFFIWLARYRVGGNL